MTKHETIAEFNTTIKSFEKQHNVDISKDAKIKLLDTYLCTVIMEKDISPSDWFEENISDILKIYAEEIKLKGGK